MTFPFSLLHRRQIKIAFSNGTKAVFSPARAQHWDKLNSKLVRWTHVRTVGRGSPPKIVVLNVSDGKPDAIYLKRRRNTGAGYDHAPDWLTIADIEGDFRINLDHLAFEIISWPQLHGYEWSRLHRYEEIIGPDGQSSWWRAARVPRHCGIAAEDGTPFVPADNSLIEFDYPYFKVTGSPSVERPTMLFLKDGRAIYAYLKLGFIPGHHGGYYYEGETGFAPRGFMTRAALMKGSPSAQSPSSLLHMDW